MSHQKEKKTPDPKSGEDEIADYKAALSASFFGTENVDVADRKIKTGDERPAKTERGQLRPLLRTEHVGFRTTRAMRDLIQRLGARLGLKSTTEVIEHALHALDADAKSQP